MYICTNCESLQTQKKSRCTFCNEHVSNVRNNIGVLVNKIELSWDVSKVGKQIPEQTLAELRRGIEPGGFMYRWHNGPCRGIRNLYHTINAIRPGEPIDATLPAIYRYSDEETLRAIVNDLSEADLRTIILHSRNPEVHPLNINSVRTCLINDKSIARILTTDIMFVLKKNGSLENLSITGTGRYYKDITSEWILDLNLSDEIKKDVNELIDRFNQALHQRS